MRILIFGGTGTIGSACADLATELGHAVTIASRSEGDHPPVSGKQFDAVVWAQGQNVSDTAVSTEKFAEVMDANVTFIVRSFQNLQQGGNLANPSRLVLVSSIWQNLSRENKFSYIVSKSALNGVVNAFTADFARHGIVTNAVLPGVVESPMTTKNLTPSQIANVTSQTPTKSLVGTDELAKIILWLASPESSGIVGQSITVDNGWSNFREI